MIARTDSRTHRIPDALNALLILTGVVGVWATGSDISAALIGIVAGYSVIAIVRTVFFKMRGYDGIGMGDAKFLAGAGAWTGWVGLPFVVLIGSVLGLAAALARGDGARAEAAFGPYLAVGLLIVWIVQTYF